ncbi:MAG TPA: glycosyltransferase family 9 protein [Ramlibacter sp.]|nr:glycosyltransferase family 9 protein [Ramlibacter sp.]
MKRILVIATRQIGDVLMTTPLVHAARLRWPQARIEVLGFAGTLGMLRGNADIDRLIESPARLGWRGFTALVRSLWRQYDLALVTQPGDRAHLMAFIAARTRSGILPAQGGSNWWKKLLLDHVVASQGDDGGTHVVAEKLALLAPWAGAAQQPAAVVPPAAAPLPADLQAQLQPGAVVLHVPSMWDYKQWPVAHYRTLCEALLARGLQVVLTGSGAARDQACIAPLRGLAPPPRLLDVSGRIDFNQLAGLLQQAALYIGPDTSVSHLAAACGVPTLAIFGPTNPVRWGPWPAKAKTRALFERSALVQSQGNVTLMQGAQACVPCSKAGCEDHLHSRSDCLQSITPQQVLEQALRLLERDQSCDRPRP